MYMQVSKGQLERVQSYIHAGIEEGAQLLVGGASRPTHLTRGYFVQPTVSLWWSKQPRRDWTKSVSSVRRGMGFHS